MKPHYIFVYMLVEEALQCVSLQQNTAYIIILFISQKVKRLNRLLSRVFTQNEDGATGTR